MNTSSFSRTFIHFDSLNSETFYIIDGGIFMLLSALHMVLVINSTSSFAAGLLCTVASFTCATSTETFLVFKWFNVIKTKLRLFVVIFWTYILNSYVRDGLVVLPLTFIVRGWFWPCRWVVIFCWMSSGCLEMLGTVSQKYRIEEDKNE